MPRLEEREQVVELHQIVLHGRRREQEHVPPLERIDELPIPRRAILAVVRLIHDDQIPGNLRQNLRPGPRLGKRERSEHQVVFQPKLAPACFLGARGNDEIEPEFLRQLVLPLRDQRRRNQDQHAANHSPEQIFAEQQAGLDGLAEPDLIRQQHASAEMTEHFANRFNLVRQMLHSPQTFQAQELVETAEQVQPGMFQMQPNGGVGSLASTGRRGVCGNPVG